MVLSYKIKGVQVEKTVSVTFDPPLAGYEEVKPRLLSLKLDAEESLGMTPRPQLTTFVLPKRAWTHTGPLIVLLIYTTFNGIGTGWLKAIVGGDPTVRFCWWLLVVSHGLESLYTFYLCQRHGTGLVIGVSNHSFSIS